MTTIEILPFRAGEPRQARTGDLLIMSQLLYPTELKAHITVDYIRSTVKDVYAIWLHITTP